MLGQENDSINQYSPEREYGFGGGCGIGGGYSVLSGNFSEFLPDYGAGIIGFNFLYGRFITDISMVIGNVTSMGEYSQGDLSINRDSTIHIFTFENTIGYFTVDKEKFSFYPFGGIQVYQLSQFQNDEKVGGSGKLGLVYGCAFDYKFSNEFGENFMGDFILGVRIRNSHLNEYYGLNVSNLNLSLYFRFMIRGYRQN